MLHEINEFDFIFLSYDEPNAEELYSDLSNKVPWAKRVSGVKGFDSAHRACANASETDFFITVDGDNLVHDDFLNVKIEIGDRQKDHAWSWAGRNHINGLVYGNGGLKLWSKAFVMGMNSHENSADDGNAVDFCWNNRYHEQFGCYSTSFVNGSPYQAFRSGFREGVKMSLDQGHKVPNKEFRDRIWIHNLHKLMIWCSVGADVENGIWSIYGARLGAYKCNLTNWNYVEIRDYDWFNSLWETVSSCDPVSESKSLGAELRQGIGLNISDLDPIQSKFFKSVYINPPRVAMVGDNLRHFTAVNINV